ncbi:MAG: hypothetical protein IID41_14635 [Planctomycetes bacterium]|nr:hypothetical protein [Planctomycetota bacterium]
MKIKHPRKILIVNPGFQWRHAFVTAGMVLIISSVLSAILYGTLHQQTLLQSPAAGTQPMGLTFVLFMSGIAFAVVITAGVAYWCLVATHRICGPLFVMTRALREVADGRLPTLRPLRAKDDFKDFYQVFAEAIDSLRIRRETEMAALNEAVELLDQASLWDDTTRERAERLVAQIRSLQTGEPANRPKDPTPCAV